MLETIKRCWPDLLTEAAGLGLFMVAACLGTAALELSGTPLRRALDDAFARRAIIGVAMGLTAVLIMKSPWGKRSGAHINPAVTLVQYRLGRIDGKRAILYALSQTIGATLGVLASTVFLGMAIMDPAVGFVVTVPGPAGPAVAFAAELAMSALMITVVLVVSSSKHAALTPYCAGTLVAVFIAFEAPLSGMSINPARTLGSAFVAGNYTSVGVYLTAPVLGMLIPAEIWRRRRGSAMDRNEMAASA